MRVCDCERRENYGDSERRTTVPSASEFVDCKDWGYENEQQAKVIVKFKERGERKG